MKLRSVLDVDWKNEIRPELFENKKSYEYFLKAYINMRSLQLIREQGCFMVHNDEPMTEDFVFRAQPDGTFPTIGTGKIGGTSMTGWIGYTMGKKPNTVFVYKKELKVLNGISYVEPEDLKVFVVY